MVLRWRVGSEGVGLSEVVGAGYHDACVGAVFVEVVGEAGVEDDAAFISGGMKEAEGALFVADGDADVGCVGSRPGGDDADDVAIFEEGLGLRDELFGNVVNSALREA